MCLQFNLFYSGFFWPTKSAVKCDIFIYYSVTRGVPPRHFCRRRRAIKIHVAAARRGVGLGGPVFFLFLNFKQKVARLLINFDGFFPVISVEEENLETPCNSRRRRRKKLIVAAAAAANFHIGGTPRFRHNK